MSELIPIEIDASALPEVATHDFEGGVSTRTQFSEQGVLELANDTEFQRRFLDQPKISPGMTNEEFQFALGKQREFKQWLKSYPLAEGLSEFGRHAAKLMVVKAVELAAQKAP